ncbi:hypothetical protein QBC35DRAFT_348527, partial [Podospora australis]
DFQAAFGNTITDIQMAFHTNAAGFNPNVIVLVAGYGDADEGIDIPQFGNRLRALTSAMWYNPTYPNPDACLVLCTVLPTLNTTGADNHQAVNEQLRFMYADLYAQGHCVYLADLEYLDILTDFEDNGMYPNEDGYAKMAATIYNAITAASDDGRIQDPKPVDPAWACGCDAQGDDLDTL